jgi:hypothetical protein
MTKEKQKKVEKKSGVITTANPGKSKSKEEEHDEIAKMIKEL